MLDAGMKAPFFALLAVLALNSARAAEVKITQILTDESYERPVVLLSPPDGSKRQFLAEQTGKIKILNPSGADAVFLDFTDPQDGGARF